MYLDEDKAVIGAAGAVEGRRALMDRSIKEVARQRGRDGFRLGGVFRRVGVLRQGGLVLLFFGALFWLDGVMGFLFSSGRVRLFVLVFMLIFVLVFVLILRLILGLLLVFMLRSALFPLSLVSMFVSVSLDGAVRGISCGRLCGFGC